MRSEERLQRAIADACLGTRAADVIARDLRSFLESHGVEPDDIEAIVAAPPRLAVYRSLVRNGLGAVVQRMLPRTRARMNAACSGRFDADLAAFAEEVGPRTHYLRDVPAELFAWAGPRWRADATVPGYLVDLATYELTAFAVSASSCAHTAGAGAAVAVAIERPLAFAESVRLTQLAWAVHELPASEDDTAEPARRDVHLLAYRDADHIVRWLELTTLAAAVVVRLLAGEALGDAVKAACADHDVVPGAVLPDVARLLADLGERGVVLGARERG
jgi:hypothetical protein